MKSEKFIRTGIAIGNVETYNFLHSVRLNFKAVTCRLLNYRTKPFSMGNVTGKVTTVSTLCHEIELQGDHTACKKVI